MPAGRFEAAQLLSYWLEGLSRAGSRGLLVAHSYSVFSEARWVAEKLAVSGRERITCIAPSEGREGLRSVCSRVLSPSAIGELLGTTSDAVVIAVRELLRPNLVAAAAETVRAGGVVALAVPPLEHWEPGGAMGTGRYKRYLIQSFSRARSIFWYDSLRGVYASRLPPPLSPPPSREVRGDGVPRALLEVAATSEQAERLVEAARFLRSRGRSVLVVGDRGRGKSGLLGLLVAYLVKARQAGFVSVTGPSPWSVQGFFEVLAAALRAVNVKHWVIRRHHLVVGVAGPWFHVRYHTPDQAQPGPYTVVDEAAALGPTRLRVLAARSPRLLAATTIHGYEGSGRVLAHIVEQLLPEPRLVVRLETPVRYLPGDPLEEWVYDTFMLRAEPPEPPRELGSVECSIVDRDRLVEDTRLLRELYGILVEAHYRNEPDDLALLLDAPHHTIHALLASGHTVAVADTSLETAETPWDARILYDLLSTPQPRGELPPGVRVVRIAVHPELQRRGLGTRLLGCIEQWARRLASWTGAVFGRPGILGFWLRNGYMVVHVSPLPNRVTGEHNIAVAKPLTREAEGFVLQAASDVLSRALYAGHSLYRSLNPYVLAMVLSGSPRLAGLTAKPPELSGTQQARLRRLVEGGRDDPESVLDAVHILVATAIHCFGGLWWLGEEERLVLAGRVVQGRTMRELAPLLGGEERYRDTLRRAVYKLVEKLGIEWRGGNVAATGCPHSSTRIREPG